MTMTFAAKSSTATKRVRVALTPEDFDWLRKLQAATDAKRDSPSAPAEIAEKLRAFGLVAPGGSGAPVITDKGRGALLEQDMRDAEDR